jgi:uncharacterized protein YcsI (UPF0317 family)
MARKATDVEMDREAVRTLPPREIRRLVREGHWKGATAGLAPGYVQANLVVIPKSIATDFLLFCQRNPKPCPLLEVTEPGDPMLKQIANGADVRTDVPGYALYQRGKLVAEADGLMDYWRDDLMAFLTGCSFTFESALLNAGVPLRHVDAGRNVPMYRTSIPCQSAGVLAGPLVVSMRPIPQHLVVGAGQVTSRFPSAHGAPVHIGDPDRIGIADLTRVDWGDPPHGREGDVPVFWACGVTPQAVALESKPELMITHRPGHMFISDLRDADLSALP